MNASADPTDLDDEALANCCAREPPDECCWTEFWRRFHAIVRWRVRAMMPSMPADEIDDVVQEVFFRFFRNARHYSPAIGRVKTYLLQITANLVYDKWRQAGHIPQTTSLDEDLKDLGETLATHGADLRVLEEAARGAVAQMDDPLKVAVLNRLLDGADVAEICNSFQIKPHFVYGVRLECIELVRQTAAALTPGPPR